MKLVGVPVFPGIVYAKAFLYAPRQYVGRPCAADSIADVGGKILAYETARAAALSELEQARAFLEKGKSPHAKILDAHQVLLEDVAMDEEIRMALETGSCVTDAIVHTYDTFISLLKTADNQFTQERTSDMEDVRNRLLRCLAGEKEHSLSALEEPVVVVAKELYPSDTATIDRRMVRAIVTETGGNTSHTAIVARSYGIPTVLGVPDATELLHEGEALVVDGEAGEVYVSLTEAESALCRSRYEKLQERKKQNLAFQQAPPLTRDGVRIQVELNLAGTSPMKQEDVSVCDGVGLLRSEFLYMGSDQLPSEEAQYQAYRSVLEMFPGKPVILRTLDIGGDKQLPCLQLPHEENPFLGNRALRLCFNRPDLFRTQLRAALRASVAGDLWVMFPMVASVDDWRRARAVTKAVMEELDAEKIPYNPQIPLGIMIEIPSVALMADKIAAEVDFASVGTNDLCQYLTAADRLNPQVAEYYQTFSPAMLRLLRFVAQAFAAAGKPVGVCGEMAGDPCASLALVGLGYRSLSMSSPSVAEVKRAIIGASAAEAKDLVDRACEQDRAEAIIAMLKSYMRDIGG